MSKKFKNVKILEKGTEYNPMTFKKIKSYDLYCLSDDFAKKLNEIPMNYKTKPIFNKENVSTA